MRMRIVRRLAAAALILAAGQVPAAERASGAQDNPTQLEEVTVEGERLRDHPGGVIVIGDDEIALRGVASLEELELPGVRNGTAGITDSLGMRGIAASINSGIEPSASVILDGVGFASPRALRNGVFDVNLAAMKGPQPLRSGRSATAGLFIIESNRPEPQFAARLDALHEFNHDEFALGGMVNVPVTDRLAVRAAGRWRELGGYVSNVATGRRDPRQRNLMGRLSLRAQPLDALTLGLKVEYSDDRSTTANQYARCAGEAFGNPRFINPAFEDCRLDRTRSTRYVPAAFGAAALSLFDDPGRPGERFHNELVLAQSTASWRFAGGYTMHGQAAWYDHRFRGIAKPDQSWNQRMVADFGDSNRQVSQMVRVDSPQGRRWAWTLTAWHEDLARDAPFNRVALQFPANQGLTSDWHEDGRTWAVFGETSVQLPGAVTAHVGGRYTDAKRSLAAGRTFHSLAPNSLAPGPDEWSYAVPTSVVAGPFTAASASRHDDSLTPSVTVEWRPGPGQMYFLGYREAFKPGGFSSWFTTSPDKLEFGPESVDYLEGGFRLGTPDDAWQLKAVFFDGDYHDLQVPVIDPDGINSVEITRNAGGARSRGADVEVTWQLASRWRLAAGAYYLDSVYKDFRDATCYFTPKQTIAQGCVRIGGAPLPPDATVCLGDLMVNCAQDLSGFPTSFAPEWSGRLSLAFERVLRAAPFGRPLKVDANVELMATGSYYTYVNGAPDSIQGGFAELDAWIGLGAPDGAWRVALVGRNLTDKLYGNWYEPLPGGGLDSGWTANLARPRQIGLQVQLAY